jgi:hypothetical protein
MNTESNNNMDGTPNRTYDAPEASPNTDMQPLSADLQDAALTVQPPDPNDDPNLDFSDGNDTSCKVMRLQDPEPWPEPVDGAALLEELWCLIGRFVILPKWAEETLPLWVLHTYAYQLREVSTYIGLESPEKRCGKTTLLSVLSEVVSRPVVASNISSPAFFRVIEELRPTLMIDEADTFLQGNDELRGILNSGYSRKTAFVVRVSNQVGRNEIQMATKREANSQLARYSCWCPKVIAAIGRLPDTLADRCIVIGMNRKTPTEKCERLKDMDTTRLRRQCIRFIRDHRNAIARAHPEIPARLNDRAADVWEPLLTLADLAGGQWPDLARQAAVGLSSIARENSPIGALLLDIHVLFATWKVERAFSRTLVEGLNRVPDRPWAEARGSKVISEIWLSQKLRPYGIQPRTMRIGDSRARGYYASELLEACKRYLPPSEFVAWSEELKEEAEQEKRHAAQKAVA